MLTRLRVQGFKNLIDVDVRFGAFTCVAGPNGAGKSNFFDAIRFLHLLTKHPIMQAVQLVRESAGRSLDPSSLFASSDDFAATAIRFEAEMVIDRKVEDDFGVSGEACIASLRYVLAFRLEDGPPRKLVLTEETLDPIAVGMARR